MCRVCGRIHSLLIGHHCPVRGRMFSHFAGTEAMRVRLKLALFPLSVCVCVFFFPLPTLLWSGCCQKSRLLLRCHLKYQQRLLPLYQGSSQVQWWLTCGVE